MKLVLQYYIDGGYECNSCLEIVCFEYDSAEAALIDFEKKLKELRSKRDKYIKDVEIHRLSKPKYNIKNPTLKQIKKRQEWLESRPEWKDGNYDFVIFNHNFELMNYLCEDNALLLPSIYELEEWWSVTKNNNSIRS